jgi:hypothetical protein
MPDFKKTQKIYEEQGISHLWKQPLELLDDKLFEAKVINPDTRTYNQVSDLPVEYRKLGENREYPVRQVLQIYRIKRADGTEWLKSRGRLVGLDKAGNEVEHLFVDPEMFYKPVTRYEFRKNDPKNEYSHSERVCVEAGMTIDTQSIRCHLTKRTLNPCTSRDRLNPHRLLVWLYSQKVQVKGRDRLQTQNTLQRESSMKCGRK